MSDGNRQLVVSEASVCSVRGWCLTELIDPKTGWRFLFYSLVISYLLVRDSYAGNGVPVSAGCCSRSLLTQCCGDSVTGVARDSRTIAMLPASICPRDGSHGWLTSRVDGVRVEGRKMQPGISADRLSTSPQDGVNRFQDALRSAIGDHNFQNWFAARSQFSLNNSTLQISVGSTFQLNWMQRRFGKDAAAVARDILPQCQLEWSVDASVGREGSDDNERSNVDTVSALGSSTETTTAGGASKCDTSSDVVSAAASAQSINTGRRESPKREGRRFAHLASFVSGSCNELALTAARQVAAQPGERFNPLYIHGGVGTGKTHLAEGIYCEIRKHYPELRVVFMTAESFANQFTQALRNQALPGFRARFRGVDVLIVDDVNFLNGKRGIQEEFLHTFEQLSRHGKQVIVTADGHPRLMSDMSNELITRFLCGLVCRLESPDAKTRQAIVRAKATQIAGQISTDAQDYVARKFVHSVRELEGALHTLHTWYVMTGKKVCVQTARQALSELERDCIRVVKLDDIQAAVCNLFGIEADDLKSAKRTRSVSQPRMLAMFLARRHTQAAYKEIGQFFGGRNHSTVVAAEKKVDGWLRSETELTFAGRNWQLSDIVESLEQQLLAS